MSNTGRIAKRGLILLATAALGACVTLPNAPTEEQLRTADYGPAPTDYRRAVKAYLEHRLRDVESARFEFFSEPGHSWAGNSPPFVYGWGVCAYINAKNAYGAYTGTKMYYFFLKGDEVYEGDVSEQIWGEQHVGRRCAQIRRPVKNR